MPPTRAANGPLRQKILLEYIEVLHRPKFGLSSAILQHWAQLLEFRTLLVTSPTATPAFPRDPNDAKFLAAAISAAADYLVTGDNDLLQAKTTLTTRIVTVADFAADLDIR